MDVQKQKTKMFFGVVQRQTSREITLREEIGETVLQQAKKALERNNFVLVYLST